MKFELGQICATSRIDNKMKNDENFARFVMSSLYDYTTCNWGEMDEEDWMTNDYSLENGERLMGVYIQPDTNVKIWIITEWDRSVTTILFPDEY